MTAWKVSCYQRLSSIYIFSSTKRIHLQAPIRISYLLRKAIYLLSMQHTYDPCPRLDASHERYVIATTPSFHSRLITLQYENLSCPANNASAKLPPLSYSIQGRSDYDYARPLVGLASDGDEAAYDSFWSKPYGTCEVPHVELFVRLLLSLFKKRIIDQLVHQSLMSSSYRGWDPSPKRMTRSALSGRRLYPGRVVF